MTAPVPQMFFYDPDAVAVVLSAEQTDSPSRQAHCPDAFTFRYAEPGRGRIGTRPGGWLSRGPGSTGGSDERPHLP